MKQSIIFAVRVILYKVNIIRTNMEQKSKEQCKTLSKPDCDVRPDCKFSKTTRKCRRKISKTHKLSTPEHSQEEENQTPVIPPPEEPEIHIEVAPIGIVIDPCDEKESTKKEAAK